MQCRAKSLSAARFAVLMSSMVAMAASLPIKSPLTDKAAPQLSVRVYSFSGLSPRLLQAAEMEAGRLLRTVSVGLTWVDCTSRAPSAICMSDLGPADLAVRVLPNALPQASRSALGMAGTSRGEAIAFIFYDRMVALRTNTRPLPPIVGRVLAHEITHLLLPPESHSELGLMRAHWTADDVRFGSSACIGLPAASVELVEEEAGRRASRAHEQALNSEPHD